MKRGKWGGVESWKLGPVIFKVISLPCSQKGDKAQCCMEEIFHGQVQGVRVTSTHTLWLHLTGGILRNVTGLQELARLCHVVLPS